jgi:hypothetical protein
LFGAIFVSAWRLSTPEGAGAAAALTVLLVLGLAFTWWEQTGFALYVAFIAAIALTDGQSSARASE